MALWSLRAVFFLVPTVVCSFIQRLARCQARRVECPHWPIGIIIAASCKDPTPLQSLLLGIRPAGLLRRLGAPLGDYYSVVIASAVVAGLLGMGWCSPAWHTGGGDSPRARLPPGCSQPCYSAFRPASACLAPGSAGPRQARLHRHAGPALRIQNLTALATFARRQVPDPGLPYLGLWPGKAACCVCSNRARPRLPGHR